MDKYKCLVCGYIYDPAENGDVAFENLPEDWFVRNVESEKISSKKKYSLEVYYVEQKNGR